MAKPSANRQTIDDLTEQQIACIEHLLAGQTKRQAAEAVGVNASTLSAWLQEPAFVAQLNARRKDVHQANTERLRDMASKAIDVIEQALESENEAVKLRAASQVLKALRLADIEPPKGPETAKGVAKDQRMAALLDDLGTWP